MHLPPQLFVALEAGGEAGLGEAVEPGWAVSRHGIKMTGSSLPSASPHPLHSKSSRLTPLPSGVLTLFIARPPGSPHPPVPLSRALVLPNGGGKRGEDSQSDRGADVPCPRLPPGHIAPHLERQVDCEPE